ncbi:MAG: hypothetical protein H0T42_33850 [Deltaproteobacteria bacterium]|nr:hypothetical protein [Deltaproteobacteria bacterium]
MAKSKAKKPARRKAVANKTKPQTKPPAAKKARQAAKKAKAGAKQKRPAARKQQPAARMKRHAAQKKRAAAKKKQSPAGKLRAAANKTRPPANKQRPAANRPPPLTKQASAERPAGPRPAAPAPVVGPDWRAALRAELATRGNDFAAYLRSLAASGWEHADTPELAGLEHWGTMLARTDPITGIGALVRVAQHGFRIAVDAGGIGLEGMGFHASEPVMDGAPVETQIELAARWLDAPDAAHLAAVAAAIDPSRQLQIWDDDLRPSDDRAHWWYLDVGQCCGHAITRTGGDPRQPGYYDWPAETCVGRGLVVAVRGLRTQGADLRTILADVRAAMMA